MLLQLPILRAALFLLTFAFAACGASETAPPASSQSSSETSGGEAALPPGVHTFVIVPAESKASYVANEELFAEAFTKFGLPAGWAKVVGTTQAVEGRFQIDTGNPATLPGDNEFTVRMNTFVTGRDMRDNWIRENGPRFNDFPVATFKATTISGGTGSYNPGDTFSFDLVGTLTIREIARPATFAVRARLEGDTLRGTGRTQVLMSTFGVEKISFVDTLTVADEVGLEVEFTARPEQQRSAS